ncbi:DUF4139 domain-containing protein [Nitrosomonas sp.]|uniref:DUF4139 domain-containing protein n=1 Tax=Nitrosomonas sp. TaxID=42353 RepID=UPI0025E00B3B|nr:DUF4139 domain-containing protein [Nitrosomonas sp.]MBY0483330.1 DUF4139 domain-containing protein [Nitrosomonas sp.]
MHTTRRTHNLALLTISCLFLFSNTKVIAADSVEQLSTLKEQKSVAVTIYNDDLALIKDLRQVTLVSGNFNLAWRDVSAQMRPETALLRSITNPGSIDVLEQNFNFDLLTPQSLLNKYIGQTVSVVKSNPATGVESKENAIVLAASNGMVLKMADRIETGIPGRIIFDNVPSNLRDRPTLVIGGDNRGAATQDIALSYLTGGLSWKADYVAELNDKDDQLDLSGWVTLTNTSGTSYPNAKLQLVAGDINRVQREFAAPRALRAKIMADAAAAPMREEALMEYHLYSLDRLTTIAENQTKQVALLNASAVPASKELVLAGSDYYYAASYGDLGQKMKVDVFVQFDNKESARLGMPLPKGIIRVYKLDKTGNAQFVGEDHIDHTAKNEIIRLKLGQSFDVTADKKQVEFKQLSTGGASGINRFESAYEITLKNAKKELATVVVQEPIPGDWKMVDESQPHSKPASNTAMWKVAVPAEGSITLKYRVQVKY